MAARILVMPVVGLTYFGIIAVFGNGRWQWWRIPDMFLGLTLPPAFTHHTLTREIQLETSWADRPFSEKLILVLGFGLLTFVGVPMIAMLALSVFRWK